MKTKEEISAWIETLDDYGKEMLADMYSSAVVDGVTKMGQAVTALLHANGITLPDDAFAKFKELVEDHDGQSVN